MGKNSKIEWTNHTFNPWWGCTKVSEACKNCYAEAWARRVGKDIWGANAARRTFSDAHWHQPIVWDREAKAFNERRRVFCASMSDVFEDRDELLETRSRLWKLIKETSNLDWLLLTKRPENVQKLVPWEQDWPANVWLGTTVENQRRLEERLPRLAECPARVRFLSCEPLLEAIDLRNWLGSVVDWVIAGGESGARARPSDPDWFRVVRDQCSDHSVPFHFKQWGCWAPANGTRNGSANKLFELPSGSIVIRANKKAAGRALDGRIWDEVPES